jgi:ketosteroid isomerase-like protein
MALQMTRTDQEAQVRGLIDAWVEAARANDIDRIMAAYAPDILSFDAIGQLQFKGIDAYRKHWQACIAMCPSPIFEIHDLGIEAGDGVAFGHYAVARRETTARSRPAGCASRSAVGRRPEGG